MRRAMLAVLLLSANASPAWTQIIPPQNSRPAATAKTDTIPAARDIPCSSLKGTIGHLLGAAGSVEAALTVLALHHGILPANRNLDTPLAGCELNLLREPQPNRGKVAVKLSLGFGGHLIGAAFRKHDG